jgi:hypothetical protein
MKQIHATMVAGLYEEGLILINGLLDHTMENRVLLVTTTREAKVS